MQFVVHEVDVEFGGSLRDNGNLWVHGAVGLPQRHALSEQGCVGKQGYILPDEILPVVFRIIECDIVDDVRGYFNTVFLFVHDSDVWIKM